MTTIGNGFTRAAFRGSAILAATALLLLPSLTAPAAAGAAAVIAGTCSEPKAGILRYTAEPGVANELSILQDAGGLVLHDAAGVITGCVPEGDDSVRAGFASDIKVVVGDEDDVVVVHTLPQGQFVAVLGGDGDDELRGSPNKDDLRGGKGDDTLRGNGGDDTLRGDAGDDELRGGDGTDELLGGAGGDDLSGGAGIDELNGGNGDDELRGEADADELNGGSGADELDGGAGTDTCAGGPGTDTTIRCE